MSKVDFKSVQEHLDFIDKRAKTFAFASYTESGRESQSRVSSRFFGDLKTHQKEMQRCQDNWAALYFSVNAMKAGSTTATKEDIERVRALFVDMDDPTATMDDLLTCPLPVHRVVETSPGKHQAYWLVEGLTLEEAEGFTRWLVAKFSADRGVWDTARVLRLPGSWHMKGEPFKVRVAYTAKDCTPYTIQDIDKAGVQWVPEQSRAKATDYTPPVDIDVEKLVQLINGGDEECMALWNAERAEFSKADGVDGSAYHMAIANMIRKCRLPIEVFDVYLRAWAARHPYGDRQNKVNRPGYIALTWSKCTAASQPRKGETWEGWRIRREAVMALFEKEQIADDGEPDIDGIEEFLTGASDDALAMRAANLFKGNMRYTPIRGTWHLWDGVKWSLDTTNRAKDALRAFLRTESAIADEYAQILKEAAQSKPEEEAKPLKALSGKMRTLNTRLRKTNTLKDVLAQLVMEAREGAEVVTDYRVWDQHDTLLATPSGVVDLVTGKTLEDGRRFFCSRATAVDPAPEGTKPKKWLKFINQIFGDEDTKEFMHRYFGYALTGYTREECFVFGFGNGRNGKGVLTNTVVNIMGKYAKTVDADMFTLAGIGQHKSALASLQGVRFVLSSEIPDGAAWNLQRIKTLTGGDEIEANFMRQDKFEFHPKLSLIICANDKPSLRSVDNSVRSRFRFIEFPNSFMGRENKSLKEDLQEEYPAILRWLIEGAAKYLQDGLTYPDSVKAATDSYLDEADVLKNWFDDVKWSGEDKEPEVEYNWFSAADLLQNYHNHCRVHVVKSVGKHGFLDYLRARGYEQERKVFKRRYQGRMMAWGPFKDFRSKI